MKIGLAIWPKNSTEWLDLALGSLPSTSTTWIGPEQVATVDLLKILVVDGDNPGPSFMMYFKSYTQKHGVPELVILGTPMSPLLMHIEWEPDKTMFVPKPHSIDDVVKAVQGRLEHFREVETTRLSKVTAQLTPPPLEDRPQKNGAKSLGYLSTLRLPDLIQMLCLSNWTGKIEITELSEARSGEIFLNVGILIHASYNRLEAEEACYKMLNWGRCEFNFVEEHPPVVQTITTQWQGIMLESARQFDETSQG